MKTSIFLAILCSIIALGTMIDDVYTTSQNRKLEAENKTLKKEVSFCNLQIADLQFNDFYNGESLNYETGKQIVFHLERAVTYGGYEFQIGEIAQKLDLFANNYAQINQTARKISQDTELFPKIVRLEHPRFH